MSAVDTASTSFLVIPATAGILIGLSGHPALTGWSLTPKY